MKRYEEAIKCFDKAIQVDPNDSLALFHKGYALHHLSRLVNAMKWYDKAIRLEPTNSEYIYYRKKAYDQLRKDY